MQNPIYKGSLRWHDKTYPGLHQPLVAESLWEKVQTIFSQRGHLGNTDSKTEIQKLLRCGYCSSPMTPSYAIKQKTKKYYYYRCTGGTHGKKSTCLFKHVAFPRIHSAVKTCLILLTQDRYFRPLETRITAHTEAKISLISLKTQLLHFRDKADTWDIATYRTYLLKILTDITYFPEKLSFHFSGLPWPIEMVMPPP